MSKSVYEKWEDIKQKYQQDKLQKITSFYMANSNTNVYFKYGNESVGVYVEFPVGVLSFANFPKVNGMTINVVDEPKINPNKKYLLIQNESDNEEIFIAFTSSLVDSLLNANTIYETYEACKDVIKEYKDYFSNPYHQLTKGEEQGLCAELLTLIDLIKKKGESTIHNWLGPSKNKRDFIFENRALEIKSTTSQIKTSITISNENQLNPLIPENLENLFLKVYVFEDANDGINVTKCIEDVNNLLVDAELKKEFKINLLKLKIDGNNYNAKYNFALQYTKCFLIDDSFPKITSEDLPKEISNITYKIDISGLDFCEYKGGDIYEQL